MLSFLLVDEADFVRVDEVGDDGAPVVKAAYDALAALPGVDDRPRSTRRCGSRWSRSSASSPRLAFGPVRVAVTGRRVSPPLFESLELLGRERVPGAAGRGGGLSPMTAGTAEDGGSPYHELHRAGDPGLWRPLVGVLVLIVVVFVAVPVGMLVPFMAYYLADRRALPGEPRGAGRPLRPDARRAWPTSTSTLASAIPVTWFLSRFLHGLKPRWLASVRPRIRWAYFVVCLLLSTRGPGRDRARLRWCCPTSRARAPSSPAELNDFTRDDARLPAGRAASSPRSRRRGRSTSSGATSTQAFGGTVRPARAERRRTLAIVDPGRAVRAGARARAERADLLRPASPSAWSPASS